METTHVWHHQPVIIFFIISIRGWVNTSSPDLDGWACYLEWHRPDEPPLIQTNNPTYTNHMEVSNPGTPKTSSMFIGFSMRQTIQLMDTNGYYLHGYGNHTDTVTNASMFAPSHRRHLGYRCTCRRRARSSPQRPRSAPSRCLAPDDNSWGKTGMLLHKNIDIAFDIFWYKNH